MYCMNCGKQVNGDIPLCVDCAMLVIQKQIYSQRIAIRAEVEAEEFTLSKGDMEPPHADENTQEKGAANDETKTAIIIGIILVIITTVTIAIADA